MLLKRELGFPDFYGMNWDTFWAQSPDWSASLPMCASSAGISSRPAFPAAPPCFAGHSSTIKPRTGRTSSLSMRSDEQSPGLGMAVPVWQIQSGDLGLWPPATTVISRHRSPLIGLGRPRDGPGLSPHGPQRPSGSAVPRHSSGTGATGSCSL
ncbi:hypothetical protein [Streptomyces olivaceus]